MKKYKILWSKTPTFRTFLVVWKNQREAEERNNGKIPYLTFLKGGKHNKYEKIQNIVEQNPDISYFSCCIRFFSKIGGGRFQIIQYLVINNCENSKKWHVIGIGGRVPPHIDAGGRVVPPPI